MPNLIRVVELFAGVGGFRIGLEGASDAYMTVWNNQWEPSTVHQDASIVYRARALVSEATRTVTSILSRQQTFPTMTC